VFVVSGKTRNLPKVNAYFNKDTGMLERLLHLHDTPVRTPPPPKEPLKLLAYFNDPLFGTFPTQIDYRDFRDVGGRKMPYEWVISQTRNREFTYAMQDVKPGAIEDAKCAKPSASSR